MFANWQLSFTVSFSYTLDCLFGIAYLGDKYRHRISEEVGNRLSMH